MTTTRRLFTLGTLGVLFGSLCSAQQSQGLDELSWVTTQIDALMAAASPMLVTIGLEIVNGFAFTIFVLLMTRLAFQFFHHHHIMIDPWPILGFLFLVAGIDVMLAYYAVPIPGVGISFSSLPDKICHYIAATIDVSSYKLVLGKAQEILTNMQQPSGVFPFMQLAVYWMVWLNMALLEALLFLVTLFGFWFYGLTQLVGPIFVALLLFPVFRQYFHAWLGTLIRFAFYRIAAAGFLFVFCNVWYKFLNDVASASYTLDHMLDMLLPMVLLNLASFLVAIRIPVWVDGVFSGSASAGHGGLIPFISKL